MHIDTTSHEHGSSAKVYSYEADYDVQQDSISWQAVVRQAGSEDTRAIATLAEQVVRDAIVKRIDTLDDQQRA
jgi:hypothetical protein